MEPVVNETMKQEVENRRRELRLELSDLVERSGLTRQGIANVRKGQEREYHESTIFGIARALEWEVDWLDRVRAGKKPRTNGPPTPLPGDFSDLQREVAALRRAVRELQQQALSAATRPPDASGLDDEDDEAPPSAP